MSRLPKGSFVVPMSLTRTRPSLQNVALPATTKAVAVPLSLCPATIPLESVANPLATMVAVLFLFLFL